MYDRVVIQDILKEIAQTQQVDLNAKQRFKGELLSTAIESGRADTLSGDHQRSRRTLARCPSRATSNDGKVHEQHAIDPLCEQYQQDHCSYQKSMSLGTSGSTK